MEGEWTQRIGSSSSRALIEAEHDAEFERAAARILGSTDIPECLRALSGRAWIAAAMLPLFMRHDTVYVDPDLAAKAALLASAVNDCRYSYGFFRSRMLLTGYPEEELDRLTADAVDGAAAEPDGHQPLVDLVRFATLSELLDERDDRAQVFERLERGGLSKEAINELAGCIMQTGFFNRVCTLLAFPPNEKAEGMPKRLLVRAVRPVLSRSMRGRRIDPVEASGPRGPFAAVLKGLRGTWYLPWTATLVDRSLDQQTEADGLPVRDRLAIIASVAGSLGAGSVESEAKELLRATGADGIPDELADWCTMSISYRAGEAQVRTERLSRVLDSGAFADSVATAALANLLARLERFNG